MILSYLSALASIRPDFIHVLLLSCLFKSRLVLNDTLLKEIRKNFQISDLDSNGYSRVLRK